MIETSSAGLNNRATTTIITGSVVGGALLGFGCSVTCLAVGGMAPALASAGPAAAQLLAGAMFPIGLSLILLSKGELATGNQYYTSMALFNPADTRSLAEKAKGAARVVLLSGAGNLIGCTAVAVTVGTVTILAGDPYSAYAAALAYKKASLPGLTMFARAVMTNILVNLAIFQAYGERTAAGKMAALWLPIACFVAMGLEHSIANMFFFPYAWVSGAEMDWLGVVKNLALVFAGNWIGAGLFMGGLHRYHILKGWAKAGSAAATASAAATTSASASSAAAASVVGTASATVVASGAPVTTIQGLLTRSVSRWRGAIDAAPNKPVA